MDDTQQIAQQAKMLQENFFAHQLFLPERLQSCTVLKAQELIMINSHIAAADFNMVMRARLKEATVVPAITSANNYFKREGKPYRWLVAPDDTPEHITQLLTLHGLRHAKTVYGMMIDMQEAAIEQVDVHIERVRNALQLQDLLSVVYQVYGDAPAVQKWYTQLLDYEMAEDDYERWYVAYKDEQPVAVAALTLYAESAGIYDIAVIRSADRQIIKAAVITQLLNYAYTHGVGYTSIVCDEPDIDFYRDLGFDDLLAFELFEQQD